MVVATLIQSSRAGEVRVSPPLCKGIPLESVGHRSLREPPLLRIHRFCRGFEKYLGNLPSTGRPGDEVESTFQNWSKQMDILQLL